MPATVSCDALNASVNPAGVGVQDHGHGRAADASPRSSAPTTRGASPTPASRSSRSTPRTTSPASSELGEPGRVPLHARPAPRDVPQAAVDDAPVRGLRVGEGVQRALPLPARARLDRACRWPSTCRPSSAWTPTTRAASARSGRTGVAIDTIDDMRTAFDGIPLDEVSTSMTINAPAAVLLLLYAARRRGAGRRRASSCAARRRTTCSRSTSRAGTTSTRRSRRCG